MRSLRLWRRIVGLRMRAQLEYRASFVFNVISSFAITFLDFVAVLAMFSHIQTLAGWSVGEIAFLYGAGGIGFALADLVIGHIEDLPLLIRSGQFDVVLIRPVGTLTQVVASDLSLRRLGKVMQAAVVLGFALTRTNISWTPGRVVATFGIMVCGALIFAAIWILGACLTFWFIGSGEVGNSMTYGGNYVTQYPLDIFGPWLRRFMGFVIPTAFVAYFPSLYILNKDDPFGLPNWLEYASPLVTVISLGIALAIWRVAVRHYRSTGS